MKQQFRRTALASLVMLMSATALVACGGGDDPAPPVVTPPSGGTDTAFATPNSNTATLEVGAIGKYDYSDGTVGGSRAITYDAASTSVTYSMTLSGSPTYAGTALRLSAPNADGDAGTGNAFNASTFTKLKIKLASSDGTVKILLHPKPVSGNGCVPTATVTGVTTTLTERTIDLTAANFPGGCGTSPTLATVLSGLFAIDVRTEDATVATHSITVGTVKLAP